MAKSRETSGFESLFALGRAWAAGLARDERNLDRGAARGIRFQGPAGQPYSQSVNVDLLEAATQSKDKTGRLVMFSTKLVQFFYTLIQFFWANGSVDKNKGGDTTTRTEIETAGSGFSFPPTIHCFH